MIAEVIVDVTTKAIDRPFDYRVPDRFKDLVKAGMRVVVPFGPRKIQGFVTKVKEETDIKTGSIKEIVDLFDLSPVLTDELLELSHWLTEKTLSYHITALQSMLPAAMKAKYEKEIQVLSEEELPQSLKELFGQRESILYADIPSEQLKQIQKHVQKGHLEVRYHVSQKSGKKKVRMLQLAVSKEKLEEKQQQLKKNAVKQKALISYLLQAGEATFLAKDLQQQTGASSQTLKTFIQEGLLTESYEEVYRDPYRDREFTPSASLDLTPEQREAAKHIHQAVSEDQHATFLLHGVTGSGKTEIYLQTIDHVLQKGKEAIVLVPEISLTPQMVQRFKERFGSNVAVLHSGLSTGEKYDEWRKIHRKEVKLVVGARSAVFAPFENLGMIIIDEEHESSYKQEEMPRYHAKDVAIERAVRHQCPVVLGSATPSLETYARAKKASIHCCRSSTASTSSRCRTFR